MDRRNVAEDGWINVDLESPMSKRQGRRQHYGDLRGTPRRDCRTRNQRCQRRTIGVQAGQQEDADYGRAKRSKPTAADGKYSRPEHVCFKDLRKHLPTTV
jgi:hypothetical protein